MLKYYTFTTETSATSTTYSRKDFVNNHKVSIRVAKMLFDKIAHNKQYKRLLTVDNSLSVPDITSRKIVIQYCYIPE